ncbi:hypothetical protein AMTR_s00002p00270590 [Amborella trichopoda]|uniref:Uncharacterized protein n=1 Tax=Amborella trichopoda TaxID=13333 RepID=W1P1J0_AMBTC|nr:hypothetical protein AMTR_s00002p00270590 [Amborella trichopoda]
MRNPTFVNNLATRTDGTPLLWEDATKKRKELAASSSGESSQGSYRFDATERGRPGLDPREPESEPRDDPDVTTLAEKLGFLGSAHQP